MQLPVMDRDEARFSTASKTMMETKNFVDIKMQDEVVKKPIGIIGCNQFQIIFLETLPMMKFGYIGYRHFLELFYQFFLFIIL